MEKNVTKGIIFMLISALGFAMMQMCVKLTGSRIPTFEQVFFRNLITMFLCGFLAIKNKERLFGKRENFKYLFLRSLFGFLGVVCYFVAINNMATADATILQKSSPLFVTLFAILLLKEKLTKSKIIVLILCLLGTIFVVNPRFNSDLTYGFIGILSACFAGLAYTLVSFLNKVEKTNTIIFFFSLFSVVCCIPFMMIDFTIPTAYELMLLFFIGIFAGIGQVGLTLGYKYAPASEVSIFAFATVPFATIFGYILFNDKLSPHTALGIMLIFISSLYTYLKNKKAML
ncbi:MAG: DMT family transporter [Tissierellia bacterium]|nr:DMT family transporter [Tissierellia bacterium]